MMHTLDRIQNVLSEGIGHSSPISSSKIHSCIISTRLVGFFGLPEEIHLKNTLPLAFFLLVRSSYFHNTDSIAYSFD